MDGVGWILRDDLGKFLRAGSVQVKKDADIFRRGSFKFPYSSTTSLDLWLAKSVV